MAQMHNNPQPRIQMGPQPPANQPYMPGQSPVFVLSLDWAMLPRWLKIAVALTLAYLVLESIWAALAIRQLLDLPKKEAMAEALRQEQLDALRGFGSNARSGNREPLTSQELNDLMDGRTPTRGSTPPGSPSGPYSR